MNILVTGANGQLGREMRILGKGSANDYIFTGRNELDITDKTSLFEFVSENKTDVIINCAAYTAVEKAEDEFEKADLLNRQAVGYLARAAAENNAVLIHISTDYIFHGDKNLPYTEEDPADPLGVYGTTKLRGEEEIKRSGCRALIFRTAWLYSPYGNNFVKTMMRLTSEKESVKVVFDQVGSPTYAEDLARAIFKITEEDMIKGNEGIYNFTNEGVCSWYDFAVEIAAEAGNRNCRITPCRSEEFPSKVKRPAFSVLDKAKIKRTFGISIPYWKDSLKKCVGILKAEERKEY